MPDNSKNTNNQGDSNNNSLDNGTSSNQSSNLGGNGSGSNTGWPTVNTSTSSNMISLQIEKSEDLDRILKQFNYETKKLAS